jgi:hypothetical protein
MSTDLTDINSRLILSVPDVFAVPQIIQGYATDDAFASEEIDTAEVVLGVDGIMSSGYIPYIVPMLITLQANSASIPNTMEAWRSANAAAQSNYLGSVVLMIPSIGLQYQLVNGVLQRVTPFPQAKRILQPVRYRISFQSYSALPMVT